MESATVDGLAALVSLASRTTLAATVPALPGDPLCPVLHLVGARTPGGFAGTRAGGQGDLQESALARWI